MFSANVVINHDPFHPGRHREVKHLTGPAPIKYLTPKTRRPFIVLRNGEAVLRKDWDQIVANHDTINVVMLPQGGGGDGGGSNAGQIVMMIVVAVLSYFTAGWAAGAYASWAGVAANSAAAMAAGGLAGAIVGIVGSALISAVIGPPKALGSGTDVSDWKTASPTYNVAAQGNSARLDGAIPVQYGRMQVYPDFVASPYVEYAGNEQYLYQLFCIGAGHYDIEAIRIEDTLIENFEEVEYEVVNPGEALDLFPAAVATSVEVSGQEAITSTWLGPFIANSAGTEATRLAVDMVCPRGLYLAEANGSLSGLSITFTVQARPIDSDGVATGAWVTLATETVSAATSTPQRYSFGYAVTAGRYEVRLQRTDTKNTSANAGHEISWAGLRAYLVADNDFGEVTLLGIKIRATNNLSQQASRKINVTCTRKLYTWTGAAWAGPTATRSIAWALYDACHTVGLPDSRIDLDGLLALDAIWTARGDTFDGRFDSTTTFWEALTRIAYAGRCKPYMQGGIVYFRRDQAVSLPVALYSMRNIVRGSFSMQFMTPSDDTADAVEVSYFDKDTWKPRRLVCKLPDSTAAKPAKIELFGVTNREQAYREGVYLAAANRYRRTIIKFTTEMEGFIPSYGDLVAINHDLPQWGQFAEVVAWDAGSNTVTLSEPMVFDAGTHYLGLRRRDGSLSGPYVVTAGASDVELVLATAPDFTPYTGQDEERTHVTFGWGDTWRALARVISIRPRDENTVELTCINEDPSVHTADEGVTAPAVNSSQLPATPSAPTVQGLDARSMPGNPEAMLITWQPAPGAEYYIVEQSADGMAWTRTAETRANNVTSRALYGSQTIIRVAAVGSLRGSWATFNYALAADYMWNASASTPMWSVNSNTMWRY